MNYKTIIHNLLSVVIVVFAGIFVFADSRADEKGKNSDGEIRLIVRGDDIGFCHSANVGCIKSYRDGIVRSVEVMVPCPWFNEAVEMLNNNPGLDVGIHLTVTCELW